jgi:cell wall-associated NlpC family hydrolase
MLLAAPSVCAAHVADTAPPAQHQVPRHTIARAAAIYSLQFLGTPYVWSGSTPAGFDCSGFTSYVYAHFGINLAHSTYSQWDEGRHVSRDDLEPGDLVFFYGVGHVGIYLGDGKFIHAPHTGTVVSIDSLDAAGYGDDYDGAVRPYGAQAAFPHLERSSSQRPHRPAWVKPLQLVPVDPN